MEMDQVELPVVGKDATLKKALEVMRARGRSGLIVERDQGPVVITAKELVQYVRNRKDREGKVTLAEIEPQSPAVDASMDFAPEGLQHPGTRRALEAAFESRAAEHAIVSLAGSSGQVVTVSESIAASLAQSITVCTCETDNTHVWLRDELVNPKKCNLDGQNVKCE
jgi:CBS domain-containing protein